MSPKIGADPEVVRRTLDTVSREAKNEGRATERLNAAIRDARKAGASLREISSASGLNHQTIANRLGKNGEQS